MAFQFQFQSPARLRGEADAVRSLLLSPEANDPSLMTSETFALQEPPIHLLHMYWEMSRPALELQQTHWCTQTVRYDERKQGFDAIITQRKADRSDLLEKKREAVAFLSTVDAKINALTTELDTCVNKKVGVDNKYSEVVAHKQAVTYLLTHSKDKIGARKSLQSLRGTLEVEHQGKVDELGHMGCVEKLNILSNINVDENEEFVGDNAGEDNGFRGEILPIKGYTKTEELKKRIIRYLKVPPAPKAADTTEDASDAVAAVLHSSSEDPPVTVTQGAAARSKATLRASLLAQLAALDDEDEDQVSDPPTKKSRLGDN